MVDGFQVVPGQLAATRAQVSALAQEMRIGLNAADADVANLLARGWTGTAARAFDSAWHEWRVDSADVLDALEETADLLLAGAQEYERQEERTRATFARMTSS